MRGNSEKSRALFRRILTEVKEEKPTLQKSKFFNEGLRIVEIRMLERKSFQNIAKELRKRPTEIQRRYRAVGRLVLEWLVERLESAREEGFPDYYVRFMVRLTTRLQIDLDRERSLGSA